MSELQNQNAITQVDEICDDPQMAHLKHKQQEKFKRHAQLSSVGEAAKFIAGPMFAIGVSTLISVIAGVAAIPMAVPVALLAVAATSLLTGIAATYKASRVWTEGQFDNYEIAAKSTAHHIAQELKEGHVEVVHQQEARHTDGKTWQEYVSTQAARLSARVR